MVVIGAVFVALLALAQPARPSDSPDQCHEIPSALCRGAEMGYNLTRMPNALGHTTPNEAGLEIHQFFPLVKVGCSASLQSFLCLLYFPECEDQSATIKSPCRELCRQARKGCESLMNRFGFQWPSSMDCAKFPSAAAGQACSAPADSGIVVSTTASPTVTPATTSGPDSSPTAAPDSCQCEGDTPAPATGRTDTAALRELIERLLEEGRALQQLQEDTLRMQRENMRLEKVKLGLEIELLHKQLERN